MQTINFTHISTVDTPLAFGEILKRFENRYGFQVKLTDMTWNTAWSDLVKVSIYKTWPDVSEVGSTWVGDLTKMDVLRSFTEKDISRFGGSTSFLLSAWKSGVSFDRQVWSIPWLLDSHILYYRRDILEKAGVDISTAFQTHEALLNTLRTLKASGVEIPLAIPTNRTHMTLHNAASWVWKAGGDFLSPGGRQAVFDTPEALEGFRQYFELGQFLGSNALDMDDVQTNALYCNGQAAMTISIPRLLQFPMVNPEVVNHTGITFPPGVPYFGTSNLVVWSESRNIREAMTLIEFLTSREVQESLLEKTGFLPVRNDVLAGLQASSNPINRLLSQELEFGRAFPFARLWGLVEDRLTIGLNTIWSEILQNPQLNLSTFLQQELGSLAHRLSLILSQAE